MKQTRILTLNEQLKGLQSIQDHQLIELYDAFQNRYEQLLEKKRDTTEGELSTEIERGGTASDNHAGVINEACIKSYAIPRGTNHTSCL